MPSNTSTSVVTGTPWHGQGVTQGGVVYLVGEGVRGIDARLTAWERHRHGGQPAEV
uniref:AAA family ATPase n=1 Tax=Rhodococcus qingshengii TaxID=334542 RepID=UPI003555C87A